ncbi:hypothetical protein NVS89_22740 [Ancylobacter sp. MQZ15Z-1]|uniref:Uncharacterized protein n=1 Tax=Ancylobacter mangrovi TaxID=2972472 RepID=A0A9X2PKE0_9HYPH|nr:hypothetical protein [Ancylobacter mangrovi]MCS0497913.1 hypothetical protein [Ancylobacter mangrovi]
MMRIYLAFALAVAARAVAPRGLRRYFDTPIEALRSYIEPM